MDIEDNTEIVARCPECGNTHPVRYKHRHHSICQSCLIGEGIMIKLLPLEREPDCEAVAVLASNLIRWKEWIECEQAR